MLSDAFLDHLRKQNLSDVFLILTRLRYIYIPDYVGSKHNNL